MYVFMTLYVFIMLVGFKCLHVLIGLVCVSVMTVYCGLFSYVKLFGLIVLLGNALHK